MVGTDRAENVFGQVLICLRMSKLDYLLKETPYSAYVTIRKKFIKSVHEDMVENRNVEAGAPIQNDEKYEKLNEELKSQKTKYAMLQFEHEELELKREKLERENVDLEDKIEEAYEESRNLKKNVKDIKDDKLVFNPNGRMILIRI